MSILSSTSGSPRLSLWSRSREPINGNEAVPRATGVISLLAIGAIHFLQIVATFEATPLLGVAYLGLVAVAVVVAAQLCVRGGDRRTWTASALITGATIGGYVFTRVLNTPLDNQDLGNWSCMLGLAALFVESTLLALSVYATGTKVALAAGTTGATGERGDQKRRSSSAA